MVYQVCHLSSSGESSASLYLRRVAASTLQMFPQSVRRKAAATVSDVLQYISSAVKFTFAMARASLRGVVFVGEIEPAATMISNINPLLAIFPLDITLISPVLPQEAL